MEIQYLGLSSFRLSGKNISVVMDPYDPKLAGLKFPKVSAEIVTVSNNHPDHNQSNLVEGVKKIILGPGEYEIGGVSFIGISSFCDDQKGALRGRNTIFVVEIDGFRIAHLGGLGHKLSEEKIDSMGEIDVLMIPVGGEYTIGINDAVDIVQDIEPKVVIPMNYKEVDSFISALGLRVEKLPKLKIKEGDLSEDGQMVALLAKK